MELLVANTVRKVGTYIMQLHRPIINSRLTVLLTFGSECAQAFTMGE